MPPLTEAAYPHLEPICMTFARRVHRTVRVFSCIPHGFLLGLNLWILYQHRRNAERRFRRPPCLSAWCRWEPDTRWDQPSSLGKVARGYHHSDSVIYGFSHTHLSASRLFRLWGCDVDRHVGKLPGWMRANFMRPAFRMPPKQPEPGYYAVTLERGNIR